MLVLERVCRRVVTWSAPGRAFHIGDLNCVSRGMSSLLKNRYLLLVVDSSRGALARFPGLQPGYG
jgi:hypothetical protein